jgi:DNA-binding protein H-NS
MNSYIQLRSQIQKLQKEAEILRKRERTETIAKIKEVIAAFELTAEDLGLSGAKLSRHVRKVGKKSEGKDVVAAKRRGRPAKKAAASVVKRSRKAGKKAARKSAGTDKRRVVAPKYRDSATGTTWTGRGKQPKWLAAALKGGKKLEDFKI